jgi:hypothetical protein
MSVNLRRQACKQNGGDERSTIRCLAEAMREGYIQVILPASKGEGKGQKGSMKEGRKKRRERVANSEAIVRPSLTIPRKTDTHDSAEACLAKRRPFSADSLWPVDDVDL